MKVSELISVLLQIIEEHGDLSVVTFDLDRETCDITEVKYQDNEIFLG